MKYCHLSSSNSLSKNSRNEKQVTVILNKRQRKLLHLFLIYTHFHANFSNYYINIKMRSAQPTDKFQKQSASQYLAADNNYAHYNNQRIVSMAEGGLHSKKNSNQSYQLGKRGQSQKIQELAGYEARVREGSGQNAGEAEGRRGHGGRESFSGAPAMKAPREYQERDHYPRVQNAFVKIYKQVPGGGGRAKKMQQKQDKQGSHAKGRQMSIAKAPEQQALNKLESTPTGPSELRHLQAEKDSIVNTAQLPREGSIRVDIVNGSRSNTADQRRQRAQRDLPAHGKSLGMHNQTSQFEVLPGFDQNMADDDEGDQQYNNFYSIRKDKFDLRDDSEQREPNYGRIGGVNSHLRYQKSAKLQPRPGQLHQPGDTGISQNSDILQMKKGKDGESFAKSIQKSRHNMNKSQNAGLAQQIVDQETLYNGALAKTQKRKSSGANRKQFAQMYEGQREDLDTKPMDSPGKSQKQYMAASAGGHILAHGSKAILKGHGGEGVGAGGSHKSKAGPTSGSAVARYVKAAEENAQRQISLPQLAQVNKHQADVGFVNKPGRQATLRQPYVDDAGSHTTGRSGNREGKQKTEERKQERTSVYKQAKSSEKVQYKSYDQLHKMNAQQQQNLEENYADVAVIKKTTVALNADKSTSYANNQTSSLKEKYGNSPYANGALPRAMRHVSMANKEKFNSLNTISDRSQHREASLQYSPDKTIADVDRDSLDGVAQRGKMKPMHSYSRLQSSFAEYTPYSIQSKVDKDTGSSKNGGDRAYSKGSSLNAYNSGSLTHPKQNRKEHASALTISKADERTVEPLVGPAGKKQPRQGELDAVGKESVDLNQRAPNEYSSFVHAGNVGEQCVVYDGRVAKDLAPVDTESMATFAEPNVDKRTSLAAASQASMKSALLKKQPRSRQDPNAKYLVDPRKDFEPARQYHATIVASDPFSPSLRPEALSSAQESHLQSKSSFRAPGEPGSAQLSAIAASSVPDTMPPIIVPKSQVTMAPANEGKRPPMTDQKVRRHDASRYEHADVIKMQPIRNMKQDLLKIQQQIKQTQKEQRMLEKDLSQLRRQKNHESNPDLNLHAYKQQYDSSKDVYRQYQYVGRPKRASKPASKKHSIAEQRILKQVNSVVNVAGKLNQAASDERAALQPVSSRPRPQPVAEANKKSQQRHGTPKSGTGTPDVDKDGDANVLQVEDAPLEESTTKNPGQKTEKPPLSRRETPPNNARLSKKGYSSPEKASTLPKSKSHHKGRILVQPPDEDDKTLPEHRRPQPIIYPAHHYQTMSSSRKNSSSNARPGGIKSLESSLGPQKLIALNRQNKANPQSKSGTHREPAQSKKNIYMDQYTQNQSNKKSGGKPERTNSRHTAQGQAKFTNNANAHKKDSQVSAMKSHLKNWREASNEVQPRIKSPLNLREAGQATELKESRTKRHAGPATGKDGQASGGKSQSGAPLQQQQLAVGSLQLLQKQDSQARSARRKRFNLEQLEVLKLLGQGSFGKVKLVRHTKTGELFAMKCLSKEAIRGRKQIQHIKNEKSILEKFQAKDFCCNIHESLQDEQNLYMFLDYLPGGELFKRIKSQVYLSEADARFYLAEVVLAIDQLHQMNIIYRDLKPENVLIDKDGHIKLIDFGFSKSLANLQVDRAFTNCGTPGYCAPEVMLDAGYTYKADIWSIGIMICEMMGGFTPFQNKNEASNPRAIMEKCRSGSLNLPKNLNGVARDLVKSLLTEDPHSRLEMSQIKDHKFFRNIDWSRIRHRNVAPPFIPEVFSYFDDDPLLNDSFNVRTQTRDPTGFGNTNRSPTNIDDVRSWQIRDGKESARDRRQTESSSTQALAPGGGLPLIDAGQSPGRRQNKSHTRKLEQIPESHLDRTHHDMDAHSDSKHSRNNCQATSTSKEQNFNLPTHNNQTQSNNKQKLDPQESYYSSKKYSATGGTGGLSSTVHRKIKMPTKVLGDYQLQLINKAFIDF